MYSTLPVYTSLTNNLQNLFFTGYGQTLLAKIVLVVALLGLAAANKLRFVPALLAEDIAALNHLMIILVVLVLLLTAILTSILTLPEA